uniref:Uncharacterized protein n=1 Tax=uncultured marine group II/III euryarchaeote KM3_88_D11 TaxID=1456535 RepID=A0A075I278_9EURY|nr:hypothetical protein [uncultured marine group II/III euryarchaeote KM3_88_D11]
MCFLGHSNTYLIGFSLRPRTISSRETPLTLITLNRTPGKSPYERPILPPIPSTRTSSCSSMKDMAPSPGAKAVSLLPVLIKLILTALRIPEFGCLASKPTFSITIPLA